MRDKFRFFIVAGLFLALMHVFARGVGPLPALGPFLSFSQGVFANAREKTFEDATIHLKGLTESVSIIFDKNGVPHIFAKNEADLYFAQGYLTAKYRLWQMDLTTRAGGAEVSEVLGKRAEAIDRFFIAIGLRKASQESFELAKQNEKTMAVFNSYTQGINAYISTLDYKTWPLEYKVVQARPQFFTPQRVVQLLKIMSFNLAARSYDLSLTEIAKKLGWQKSVELFPDYYSDALKWPGFDDFFHQPDGGTSNEGSLHRKPFMTAFDRFPKFLLPFHTDGSNSWLVSKELTESGFNILANDTHLGLRAPPIWFENRLYIENDLDVYGASFPGAPTVILGFNKDFAWGATNGTIDVVDWFEIEFKSEDSSEYLLDGKWTPTKRIETLLNVRGKPPENISTLWTEFGPVVHREGKLGLAVRWTAHEPSNEASVFYELDRAHSVKQAKTILKKYKTPIQNFSLADKDTIAIVTAGIFPEKDAGFGRVVENGRLSANNWQGFVRANESLTSTNPQKGFLHSANQRPAGSDFGSYLGWDFEEPFRGLRIKEKIKQIAPVSLDEMMQMQNEAFNELAFYFFKIVDRDVIFENIDGQPKTEFATLAKWDLLDLPESTAPTLFYSWFKTIEKALWGKMLSFQDKKFFPKKARTLIELSEIKKRNSKEFYDFLEETFAQSLIDFEVQNPNLPDKSWGEMQPTIFKHVTQFPGFESLKIKTTGSKFSLNSNKGSHGGAWRLVVKMSDPIEAFSQIPGSIEGNPLKPEYFSNIEEWANGKFHSVQFLSKTELLKQRSSHMELRPK